MTTFCSIILFSFFKGDIAVGGSCEHNKQCTGTADANICRSRKCACQTGYILIENNCYEGKILTQTSWIYYYKNELHFLHILLHSYRYDINKIKR